MLANTRSRRSPFRALGLGNTCQASAWSFWPCIPKVPSVDPCVSRILLYPISKKILYLSAILFFLLPFLSHFFVSIKLNIILTAYLIKYIKIIFLIQSSSWKNLFSYFYFLFRFHESSIILLRSMLFTLARHCNQSLKMSLWRPHWITLSPVSYFTSYSLSVMNKYSADIWLQLISKPWKIKKRMHGGGEMGIVSSVVVRFSSFSNSFYRTQWAYVSSYVWETF